MDELSYYRIPKPPKEMSATSIMKRLVDGIGFRYRWATEGLRDEDLDYQPCTTAKNIKEILAHIHGLLNISESFITGKQLEEVRQESLDQRRRMTLETVTRISDALTGLDDKFLASRKYRVPWHNKEFPVWNLINGPLSDVLTHIGQVASWRRINNNPIPRANVFLGEPAES
jgi:hypothetical protein